MRTNVILAEKCNSQLAIIIQLRFFCENVVVVKTSYQMLGILSIWQSGEGFIIDKISFQQLAQSILRRKFPSKYKPSRF